MFLPIGLLIKDLVPPFFNFSLFNRLAFSFVFFNFVVQIFISARFNEESKIQRLITLVLSVLKILVGLSFKIVHIVFFYEGRTERKIDYILSADILIASLLQTYFLFIDYLCFGSGLKETLKSKNRRLTLKH